MNIDQAYHLLFMGALIIFAVLIGIMLIRAVIGPRITDRILSINMIGTMTICSIAILSGLLHEGYLTDVALIYAMLSFVAVLILAVMYIPAKSTRQQQSHSSEPRSAKHKKSQQAQPGESLQAEAQMSKTADDKIHQSQKKTSRAKNHKAHKKGKKA